MNHRLIKALTFLLWWALCFTCMAKASTPPSLTEVQKKDLVIAYLKAVNAQMAAAEPMRQYQQAVANYNNIQKEMLKISGFPDGSTVTINADTLDVIVMPPTTIPTKPEEKK